MIIGRKIRRLIAGKTNGRCGYCGMPQLGPRRLIPEHMIPASRGGTDDADNLVPACNSCNVRKRNMTVEEFRAYIPELLASRVVILGGSFYDYEGYISREAIEEIVKEFENIAVKVRKLDVRFFMERIHDPDSWRTSFDEY